MVGVSYQIQVLVVVALDSRAALVEVAKLDKQSWRMVMWLQPSTWVVAVMATAVLAEW